jgi:hypothetical protein
MRGSLTDTLPGLGLPLVTASRPRPTMLGLAIPPAPVAPMPTVVTSKPLLLDRWLRFLRSWRRNAVDAVNDYCRVPDLDSEFDGGRWLR